MLKFIKNIFKKNKKTETKSISLQPLKKVVDTHDCIDMKNQPKKKAGRPKSTAIDKKPVVKKATTSDAKQKAKKAIEK